MRDRYWLIRGLGALFVGLLLVGCGEGAEQAPVSGLKMLSGNVEIDGSSTVYPISEAVASAFSERYPNINVTVAISGTGGGFKRFVKGEIDIADASRPILKAELKRAASNDVEFLELPIALDGVTVVVNPANDWVEQLTVDQLREIFSAKTPPQTWSDVNPKWPDKPIKIYAPGPDSGTFDYFKEVVIGDKGAMRGDMTLSEDDNVLVLGVAGDEYAIGFFGAAYYFNNKEDLKAVPIVNPKTGEAVLPTDQAVRSGAYAPFTRPLFIYVKAAALQRPEMRIFVEFYLKHAAEAARKVDFVPLSEQMYDRVWNHYQQRLTGTHFWQLQEGQIVEREGTLQEVYRPKKRLTYEQMEPSRDQVAILHEPRP